MIDPYGKERPLVLLIQENEFQSIAEVGIYYGSAMRDVLTYCATVKDYYAVDPWMPYSEKGKLEADFWEDLYSKIVEEFGEDERVHIMRMTSVAAASLIAPESLDIVFIDAAHDKASVMEDIVAWWPKVREGGILSGHDYHGSHPGVAQAVDEFFSDVDVGVRCTTWFVRKEE